MNHDLISIRKAATEISALNLIDIHTLRIMKKLSDTADTSQAGCAARAWLATVLLGVLSAGVIPAAHAQSSGALPIYRCVSADGTSSRISRTPCAVGETGTAKQAVAGTSQHKPAIVHQTLSAPAQSQAEEERTHRRTHTSHRSGRRR